jgi:pimeloyl-ACP methyl ester carboxylesterase
MSATIVLLPGLLCDASVWETQRAALESITRVVVADFSAQDSIAAMAQSALDLATGPLIVIGHSMGGRVALEMWRLAPERIVKLALLDTGIHPQQSGEILKRQRMIDLAYNEGMAALADVWLPPMVDPRRSQDGALLAPMREMVLRATPDQHARQIKALLDRPDARPVLATITCPTLVLVGRQDQWSPLKQHEEMAGLIAGARLVVIEDSGHMTTVEQPEATARALKEWVLA